MSTQGIPVTFGAGGSGLSLDGPVILRDELRGLKSVAGASVATTAALTAIDADNYALGQRRTVTSSPPVEYICGALGTPSANVLTADDGLVSWYKVATAASVTAVAANSVIKVDEWTDPAAVSTTALKAATATTVAPQTILAAALVTGGKTALSTYPRNLTFTTGGTATDAPASVTITGTDVDDAALVETLALSQSAGTDQGIKAFKTVTSVVYGAGVGTGGTVAIGIGKKFGLTKKIKSRAGLANVLSEIAIGVKVTTGTVVDAATSAPYGTYAPSANPNGTTDDFALVYEQDLS